MVIFWDITNKCSQKCRHCYNYRHNNLSEYRDITINKNVIDRLNDFICHNNVELLTITGGEPLLKKDIFKILEKISNKVLITVTTNGLLLIPAICFKLVQSRLVKLAISLESAEEDIYNRNRGGTFYRRFLQGLNNISSSIHTENSDISSQFSVTVLKDCLNNKNSIRKIYELAMRYDIDGIQFQYPISVGNSAYQATDGEYIIQSAEWITQLSKQYSTIEVYIQYKKILLDYCNTKYDARIMGGKTICPAGNDLIYLNNRLEAFPCIIQNEGELIKKKISNKFTRHNESLSIYNHIDIRSTEYYHNFIKLKEAIRNRCIAECCNNCIYFQICFKLCPYDSFLKPKSYQDMTFSTCRLLKEKLSI